MTYLTISNVVCFLINEIDLFFSVNNMRSKYGQTSYVLENMPIFKNKSLVIAR